MYLGFETLSNIKIDSMDLIKLQVIKKNSCYIGFCGNPGWPDGSLLRSPPKIEVVET